MTDPRIERLTEMVAALRQEGYNRQESIELLYARIEALEAAQQPAGTDHAGWHRLSDVKPLNGAQCLFRVHPNLLHSKGVWVDQSHSLTPSISPSGFYTDLGLFVGNPALIWWSAIEPEAQQPAQATEESSVTAPPAPADGLVERIRDELGHHGTASASAVLLLVAKWLDGQIEIGAAHMLRQEANR